VGNTFWWVILAVFIGLPVIFGTLFLFLRIEAYIRHVLFWRRVEKEQIKAHRVFSAALQAPDWTRYRQQLGRKVPERLRQAYADRHFIEQTHSFRGQSLSFLPIGEAQQDVARSLILPAPPFAELGEDPLFLQPGPAASNAVYGLADENADTPYEEISPSLEAFMEELGFAGPPPLNRRR